MNNLLTFPNILYLALVLVVLLVVVHLVALKVIGRHFRNKYPEAFAHKDHEKT